MLLDVAELSAGRVVAALVVAVVPGAWMAAAVELATVAARGRVLAVIEVAAFGVGFEGDTSPQNGCCK